MTRDQYIRAQLERFIDMYGGMDAGNGDPVHRVREHARQLLDDGEPSVEDFLSIGDEIAAALPPNDSRAQGMRHHWTQGLRAVAEQGPLEADPDIAELLADVRDRIRRADAGTLPVIIMHRDVLSGARRLVEAIDAGNDYSAELDSLRTTIAAYPAPNPAIVDGIEWEVRELVQLIDAHRQAG